MLISDNIFAVCVISRALAEEMTITTMSISVKTKIHLAFLIKCNTNVILFLQRNGHQLVASEDHAYEIIMKLSTGQLTKKELAEWIRENSSTLYDS